MNKPVVPMKTPNKYLAISFDADFFGRFLLFLDNPIISINNHTRNSINGIPNGNLSTSLHYAYLTHFIRGILLLSILWYMLLKFIFGNVNKSSYCP